MQRQELFRKSAHCPNKICLLQNEQCVCIYETALKLCQEWHFDATDGVT